jgi:hypothetical protein
MFMKESDRHALWRAANEQTKEHTPERPRRSHMEHDRVIVDKPLSAVSDPFDRLDQCAFDHKALFGALARGTANATVPDPAQMRTN